MRSTDALGPLGRLAWNGVRRAVPKRARFFYEGHPPLRGQLWFAERRLLYDTVRAERPHLSMEVGTWRGGGSTLFVAQALHDNGAGMLHTIEVSEELYDEARHNYDRHVPHLLPHVTFHLGDYHRVYPAILASAPLDLLLLDGAEDAEQTLAQYLFFLPAFRPGTLLIAHDWFTEKTRLLRPHVENAGEWRIEATLAPPASVGFVIARRR